MKRVTHRTRKLKKLHQCYRPTVSNDGGMQSFSCNGNTLG